MKKVFALVLVSLISVLVLSSCNEARKRTLDRLLNTESGDYRDEKVSKERIAELEEGIKEYSAIVEEKVKAAAEIGIYYRMVALEYMDLELYGLALENLESSLEYYPSSPELNYYAGLASANIARGATDEGKRDSAYLSAEEYYKAAVRLRNGYVDAMYALSVLYLFELSEPYKAEPLLKGIIDKDPSNWDARFLYARFLVMTGSVEEAIDTYGLIAEKAWSDEMKARARENLDSLMEGRY